MRAASLTVGLLSSAVLAVANGLTYDDAVKHIQTDLQENYPSTSESDLCEEYKCCNVTSTESCDLKAMPKDETTLVLPGRFELILSLIV